MFRTSTLAVLCIVFGFTVSFGTAACENPTPSAVTGELRRVSFRTVDPAEVAEFHRNEKQQMLDFLDLQKAQKKAFFDSLTRVRIEFDRSISLKAEAKREAVRELIKRQKAERAALLAR